MLETLRFQAEARAVDLLWQPQLVARTDRSASSNACDRTPSSWTTSPSRPRSACAPWACRTPMSWSATPRPCRSARRSMACHRRGRPPSRPTQSTSQRCGPSPMGSARPSAMPTVASCARWHRGASPSAMPLPPTVTWSSTPTLKTFTMRRDRRSCLDTPSSGVPCATSRPTSRQRRGWRAPMVGRW